MRTKLPRHAVLLLIKYSTVNSYDTMARIKVTKVRSTIDRPPYQKATMEALGLRKMNQCVEHEATPQILGMVRAVNHLVKVEEVNA